MSKKKIPKSLENRPDTKSPKAKPTQAAKKPSWRFSSVDKDGPFAWPIEKPEELVIVKKLRDFDSMEWSEIAGPDHHSIPVNKLSKEARKRLEEIKQDDIDEIFSFHLTGKSRIICIKDLNIAKLLWFDPEHNVCPSQKKNT